MAATTVKPITGDQDPTTRVNKKLKKHELTTPMDSITEMDSIEDDNHQPLEDSDMAQGWGTRTFSEVLGGKSESNQPLSFYTGEDEEERFEGVDALFSTEGSEEAENALSPRQVEIPKDKYMSLFSPWRGALILKLLGKTVSLRVLQQRTSTLWGLQWGYELIDMEHGFFLARFFTREDYLRVLEGGPWIVMGHYLTVTKWRPNFRPSTETISSTLVWVRFPELPIELFDEEVLSYMGDAIGKTIKVDDTTVAVSRGRYARVCVEIDLNAPLVPVIKVLGSLQRVEYEGLHLICFECGRYGHKQDMCPATTKSDRGDAQPPLLPSEEATGFGPWMLPRNNSRRHRQTAARTGGVPSSAQPEGATTPTRGMGQQGASARSSSLDQGAAHKAEMKGGPTQVPQQGRPGFRVLAGLPEGEDLETTIQQLKQQIQDITRPSSGMKIGKAHSPVPEPVSLTTRGKVKRGGRGPDLQARAKGHDASSSRTGTGVGTRPNATGKQVDVGSTATTGEVEGDLGKPR